LRAKALGVDLTTLQGAGPHGTITLQDVERAAQSLASAVAAPADITEARAGIRNAIAASMSRGKREIPHYYLQLTMDFTPAMSWLAQYNETRPPPERLLPGVLMIKAVARAAAEKPGFNGYFNPGGFEPSRAIHTGVAIALRGGGLVAPALFDANEKPLAVLMRELQDLVTRVRKGHMRSSEVSSATITITSLGDEGADMVLPIIYPPQVAIVGFGSVVERPWVIEGRIEARSVLTLTLAADHRVTDGRQGAQFLAKVRDALTRPAEL
jgi:pyruvate dehydrogenase E2 component (dihydrolipoamide acetyltransferase)